VGTAFPALFLFFIVACLSLFIVVCIIEMVLLTKKEQELGKRAKKRKKS